MLKRSLSCQSSGFSEVIKITISSPKKTSSDEFICQFGINGGKFSINKSVIGIDSIQAVILALRIIKNIITSSDDYKSGNIFWLEKGNDINLEI